MACRCRCTASTTRRFLAWHRAYLYYFELTLKEYEPAVTLPWWDLTSAWSHQMGSRFVTPLPRPAAGVLGRTAVIDLAIAAQYGDQLDAIAREVQQRAIAELRANAGLHDVTVNVTIDDVIT
jgi:hypothetical protein